MMKFSNVGGPVSEPGLVQAGQVLKREHPFGAVHRIQVSVQPGSIPLSVQ